MRIAHREEVGLFREVVGVEQDLIQKIVGTYKEVYSGDIRNSNTNYINDTVAGVLTHLQENYGQLMPHDLLEREDIVKKSIYNPCDLIAAVLSTVKELLKFAEITGKLHTQLQVVNIAYITLHQIGKFRMTIL